MSISGADIVGLDRIAVRESLRVVAAARPADWDRDTPCAGWTLRRLVAHMTAQHHGFAAAARGAGREAAHWREPAAHRSDPGQAYRASVTAVLTAFAEPGVTEREFDLPEFGSSFPGRVAVGFHFIDYVVHAWDVAVSLGVALELPAFALEAAVVIARRVPADPERRGAGFAFAPALEVSSGSDPLTEALRLLGRDPDLRPSTR
ncbi:TIGR03086 family metal-binding protein [Streptomyces sp. NPDC086182]|uniref:TIGR03086 family metal-binding protein n=1 Tax=Streptomyces sp. NPDC086182 TaxID=3155058 RepID=UPI0034143CA0